MERAPPRTHGAHQDGRAYTASVKGAHSTRALLPMRAAVLGMERRNALGRMGPNAKEVFPIPFDLNGIGSDCISARGSVRSRKRQLQ